jgi:hypothetical protein
MRAPIRAAWLSRPGWSPFGRVGPNGNSHGGFDYYVPAGTPVYATGLGKVGAIAYNGDKRMGFGHNIGLLMDDGRKTIDAHFQNSPTTLGLRVGSRVDENTIVGYVGNTGNAWNVFWSTGGRTLSHLHHEEWATRAGPRVNPLSLYGTSHTANIGTPLTPTEEEDMTPEQDKLLRGVNAKLDNLQRVANGSEPLLVGMNGKLDDITGGVVKLLVRGSDGGTTDLQNVIELLRSLPTETVAALKAAL